MGGVYGLGQVKGGLSTNTEILDITSGNSQLAEPILPSWWVRFGMFRVESQYCSKN